MDCPNTASMEDLEAGIIRQGGGENLQVIDTKEIIPFARSRLSNYYPNYRQWYIGSPSGDCHRRHYS